jgi:hypothetical protein
MMMNSAIMKKGKVKVKTIINKYNIFKENKA